MPLYEYECQDCRNVTEILQRNSKKEQEDLQCPECGSRELRRKFSVFSTAGNSNKTVDSCPTGTCPLS